jgi:hypothetical protein
MYSVAATPSYPMSAVPPERFARRASFSTAAPSLRHFSAMNCCSVFTSHADRSGHAVSGMNCQRPLECWKVARSNRVEACVSGGLPTVEATSIEGRYGLVVRVSSYSIRGLGFDSRRYQIF